MAKPSETQISILKLMADGWELATGLGFDSSAWIQRGGESKRVGQQTVRAMEHIGLIETHILSYPTKTFRISRYGNRVLKEVDTPPLPEQN